MQTATFRQRVFTVLAGVAALCGAQAGDVTLCPGGNPMAAIVTAAQPTKAAQLAAYELQDHFALMSGVTLPIHAGDWPVPAGVLPVYVGDSAAARQAGLHQETLKSQEYAIRLTTAAFILVGKDANDRGEVRYGNHDPLAHTTWPGPWEEAGTLYAVYDFLERFCGVRWYTPTEIGRHAPPNPFLTIAWKTDTADVRRQPVFATRYAMVEGNVEGYDAGTTLWRADSLEFKQYEQAAYAGIHQRFPDAGRYTQAKRAAIRLFLFRQRAGGEKCFANHSMYDYYQRFWGPDGKGKPPFFEKHRPELFAQGYEGEPLQLCYTSQALIDQLTQDARNYFDKGGYANPPGSGHHVGFQWGENCFAVEPMDNASFCKCDACRAWFRSPTGKDELTDTQYRDSNYMFNFVNEVAKRVRQTHPNKWIVTLAYGSHLGWPDKVKLEPNVAVYFCFDHNRMVYARDGYNFQLKELKKWRAKEPDRPILLWLYYTFPKEVADNGNWFCFPGAFAHTIDKQFKLYRDLGLRGMFHCGYGQDVEAYLTYRLMDEPSLATDNVLDDYFGNYFGPAAGPMKKFYAIVEEAYSNPKNYPKGYKGHQSKIVAWDYLGNAKRMAELGALVSAARQAVAATGTGLHKQRLDLFEKSVWSYMQAGRAQHEAKLAAAIPKATAPRVPAAGGDPDKVLWDKAGAMPDPWYIRGGTEPSKRKFSGKLAHDGEYVYLELVDPCDTTKLYASASVFAYDTWEMFVANRRQLPYRQYASGPTGLTVGLSHGEVNWRMNVPLTSNPMKVVTRKEDGRWVSRYSWPMATMLAEPLKPGGILYLNVTRVTSPQVRGAGGLGIDSWVSYCTVHDVDRLAEIALAP